MSPGLIAFLVVMACLSAFYAIFAPENTKARSGAELREWDAPDKKKGLFDQLVRPAISNLLPRTPEAATTYAAENGNVQALLAKSGNPWRLSPEEYLVVRILSVVVVTAVCWSLALGDILPLDTRIAAGVGLLIGYLLPGVYLGSQWTQRRRDLDRALPEALDLIRICMNAGYNFQNALTQTVLLLPEGTTREELKRVVAEIKAGRNVTLALEVMSRRCPTEGVDAFARAISQAQSTGSDIAATLAYQSADTRAEYERQIDVKAQKLQTTLFLPIIALLLPSLMIFMFGPSMAALNTL